jgi:hypothetical protein
MKQQHLHLFHNYQYYGYNIVLFMVIISLVSLVVYPPSKVTAKSIYRTDIHFDYLTPLDLVTSDPFGFIGYTYFYPRFTYGINGNLIENTDYGIKNPDLGTVSTCFNQPWNNIYHSGEDLYCLQQIGKHF